MSVICNEHWHDLRDVVVKNFKKDSQREKMFTGNTSNKMASTCIYIQKKGFFKSLKRKD